MMECYSNTEIVVYDNNSRLASLMYYGGDTTNKITIGRNMGWGAIRCLQVGGAGRLKIGSGTTDHSFLGTLDTDSNTTNTKIFWSGNTCNFAGTPGSIQHFATGTGGHTFYSANSEKMRSSSDGTRTANGDKLIFLVH